MINKELADQLKTKDECFELIADIAVDYDGESTQKGLKNLINEMSDIAKYGFSLSK